MTEKEIEDLKRRLGSTLAEMYEPFTQRMRESMKRAKEESLSKKYDTRLYTIKKVS